MFGSTTRTVLKSPTGRRVTKEVAKGTLKAGSSRGGRRAEKAAAKGAGKLLKAGAKLRAEEKKAGARVKAGREASRVVGARGLSRLAKTGAKVKAGKAAGPRGLGRLVKTGAKVKAGKEATKAGAKSASKAGRGFGKLAAKKGKREFRVAEKTLQSERSGGGRLLKFSLLAVTGLGIGALVARALGGQDSTSTSDGSAGPGSSEAANDARGHSDPSSGPLIGESHHGDIEGVTESQPEAEQRIRTRIGEDERTRDMPRVNVEVNGGVAELRGAASTEEVKEAAGEIAAEVEGVSEVRNLIEVES